MLPCLQRMSRSRTAGRGASEWACFFWGRRSSAAPTTPWSSSRICSRTSITEFGIALFMLPLNLALLYLETQLQILPLPQAHRASSCGIHSQQRGKPVSRGFFFHSITSHPAPPAADSSSTPTHMARRPPRMRKGEEDNQSLTPSAPQGPNTWTSSDINIFFHSAQGQATAAIAADAAMERRTMTLSSSRNSRQVHATSSVNDDADHMFNCSPIHRINTK